MEKRLSKRAERRREKTSQMIHINDRENQTDAFPTFDLILTPNLSLRTIMDRLKSSRQDPETGIVYHPVANPVPDGDKKLEARLVELEFDAAEVEESFKKFDFEKEDL
jgi:hypothetical protein